MSSDSGTVFSLKRTWLPTPTWEASTQMFINVMLRVLMFVPLSWPGCCPEQI